MNNKKRIIAKVSSIAILSTSLLSFIPLNVDAYYNNNEKIIINGSQVIRVYGSTSSSNSTSDNNYSTDDDNSIPNNNADEVTNGVVTDKQDSNSVNADKVTSITTKDIAITSNSKTLEKSQIEKLVYEMLDLINDDRKKNGLEALILDESLTSVAQMKAEDMVENDYLSHYSAKYGSIYSMIRNAGIRYYNAGENIAKNYSIKSTHNSFMNSYMHRNAILAPHFTHVGIGIDKPTRGMYKISVMFIEKK